MAKLLWLVGANVGGGLGWWLGGRLGGLGAAFFLSLVGTGLGVYWARRFVANHF